MQFKNLKWKQSMIKVINNMWSLVKMSVILLIMVIIIKFIGTEQLLKAAGVLLGFYTGFKLIDLLFIYLKTKINGVEEVKQKSVKKSTNQEINPEIIYIEGLIDKLKNKVKKTVKDKNNLDLLNIKLKQLKNIS